MVTMDSLSLLAIWMWQTIGLSTMADQCDHGLLVGWSFADHSLTNGKCQGPRANWQESRASLVTAAMETVGRPLHLTFAVSWQEASQDIISSPSSAICMEPEGPQKTCDIKSHHVMMMCNTVATTGRPSYDDHITHDNKMTTRWPRGISWPPHAATCLH